MRDLRGITVRELSGIGCCDCLTDNNTTANVSDIEAIRLKLVQERNDVATGKIKADNMVDRSNFVQAITYVLDNWNDAAKRTQAIAVVQKMQADILKPAALGDDGDIKSQVVSAGISTGIDLIKGSTSGGGGSSAAKCDTNKIITGFWDFTKPIPAIVSVNECVFYQQLAPNNIKLFGSVDAYSVALMGMYRFVNDYPNWQSVVQQILAFQQAHYGVALFGPFLTMYSTDPAQARGLIAQYLGIQSNYSGNTPAPSSAPGGNTNNNGGSPTPYTPGANGQIQTAGFSGTSAIIMLLVALGTGFAAYKSGVFNSKKVNN